MLVFFSTETICFGSRTKGKQLRRPNTVTEENQGQPERLKPSSNTGSVSAENAKQLDYFGSSLLVRAKYFQGTKVMACCQGNQSKQIKNK